jgi:phage baseplate assembly protein W
MADTNALPLTPTLNRLVDINYSYSIGPSDQILSVGEEVIIGDVFNVLSTYIGDEPGNPTYGSNLPKYVFELFTAAVEQRALLDVYTALKNNIPQLTLSISNTNLFVSPSNRIVGIAVGLQFEGRLITMNMSFAN